MLGIHTLNECTGAPVWELAQLCKARFDSVPLRIQQLMLRGCAANPTNLEITGNRLIEADRIELESAEV